MEKGRVINDENDVYIWQMPLTPLTKEIVQIGSLNISYKVKVKLVAERIKEKPKEVAKMIMELLGAVKL